MKQKLFVEKDEDGRECFFVTKLLTDMRQEHRQETMPVQRGKECCPCQVVVDKEGFVCSSIF